MSELQKESRYILRRGSISGPFPIDQIVAMRRKGALDQFSKVSIDRATWEDVDGHLAKLAAAAAAPPPIVPPPFYGFDDAGRSAASSTNPALQDLSILPIPPFPIAALLLLHFLTLGVYSFFHVTSLHGRLVKLKTDDPSAFHAVVFCFVPFYNFYWLYFVYLRLTQRINRLCNQHRLRSSVPEPLAYALSTLVAVPLLMAVAGLLILSLTMGDEGSRGEAWLLFFMLPQILTAVAFVAAFPVFAVLVQASINRVYDLQIRRLFPRPAN